MRFEDQNANWDYTVDSMPDPTFAPADPYDAKLENFLSRPIRTRSYSWAVGTNIFEKFNPWTDFLDNPRVINRLANFNRLRCKLKVRILLNGNGFHYGRAIASYTPLIQFDTLTKDRLFFQNDIVGASQRPHVYLDPSTNQGGTLTLPFVWYMNALNIPDRDWKSMGDIIIHGINPLRHANNADDEVIVSVFVWAEEVSMTIPTSSVPAGLTQTFTPQMGIVYKPQAKDEYGTGPISRPAGYIAKVAGALSKVPGIGMYAKATQMAASTVSSVATMFGYSRPPDLSTINSYKPTLMGNMANTNVPDTCHKLTLDAKQELTIDPRTMGLGDTDELTIKSIAGRESYLTKFSWGMSDPVDTLLWNARVNPVLWAENDGEYHFPACCFATLPFDRWRGSMKFRFQIVASAYHKGRLRVVYDPREQVTDEFNINYQHVIDLASERDFTMTVGWGHEKAMLNHFNPGSDSLQYGPAGLPALPNDSLTNGMISIYVVNDLTTPNSLATNDIEINVFISMCDDFEVYGPTGEFISDYTWFQPQMGEVTTQRTIYTPQMAEVSDSPASTEEPQQDSTPVDTAPIAELGMTLDEADNTIQVYYGDPITSFRQCFKRYNYHHTISPDTPTLSYLRVRMPNFPFYRGYAPAAVHKSALPVIGTPYNYCKMTLLNWVVPAFTCYRGALRWKYLRVGGASDDGFFMVSRSSRRGYEQTDTPSLQMTNSGPYERNRDAFLKMPHTWEGNVTTSTRQNPAVEVELPYYSNVRFSPAKFPNVTQPGISFGQSHQLDTLWESSTSQCPQIHAFVSTGEDFTCGFFTGCPIAYYVPDGTDPDADNTVNPPP
jgi:hypothetical protein